MGKNKGQRNPNETAAGPAKSNGATEGARDQRKNPKPFYKKYNFWMLVVVSIYSVTAIGLWCQTKRATEATKESADAQVATVRAWMWPVKWQENHIPSFADMQAGKWAPFDFQLLNVGHTPAINPRMRKIAFIYHADIDSLAMPEFPHCPDKPPPEDPGAREAQVVLPNEGPQMHLAATKLSADQYYTLFKGHATLTMWGCVYYNIVSSDQIGISEYCMEWRPDGRGLSCHGNNSMK